MSAHGWRARWPLLTWLAVAALTILLGVLFGTWTATQWHAFPRFVVAIGYLFLVPGLVVLLGVRGSMAWLERVVLAMLVGMVVTSLLYWVSAACGVGWVLWLWIAACMTIMITRFASARSLVREWVRAPSVTHLGLVLALAAAILPLVFIPFYFHNFARSHGTMTFASIPDILLHASIASELTHTIPPQVPFLAGERLSYHVGMDTVTAVLIRFGGLSVMDLVVRYCPTLFIVLDVLMAFCALRRFGGGGLVAVVVAAMAVLGEDLSFIPGLFTGFSDSIWAVRFFQAPTTFALYFVNPMVMAHGLLFASLFCFQRCVEDREGRWWIPAGLCAAALIQTKFFGFMQLGLALVITMLVWLMMYRRLVLLVPSLAFGVLSLPLLWYTCLGNAGGGKILWTLCPGLNQYVTGAFREMGYPSLAAVPWLVLPVYIILTFGARMFGGYDMVRALKPREGNPFPFFLAVFVIVGPILTLATKVIPKEDPSAYNNAIWFMVQSKHVAWLFVGLALSRVESWSKRAGVLVAALVVLISIPSTIQFFHNLAATVKVKQLDRPTVDMVRVLARESVPGAIIMTQYKSLTLAGTACRVPYHELFARSFASRGVLESRQHDDREFWGSWRTGVVDKAVLARSGAEWVVSSRSKTPASLREGTGAEGLDPLVKVRENEGFILYRVTASGGASDTRGP